MSSDGLTGTSDAANGVGEKWDQIHFYDVDGDGDLDIVANVEEYHENLAEPDLFLGAVWFENPGRPLKNAA